MSGKASPLFGDMIDPAANARYHGESTRHFPALHTLMIQGCTSDAGKSTVVAALCRLYARAGIPVVPFKPQNMALNSAVTIDGGEIGRAQALQAIAAGIPAHTDMNPVLLKPSSDTGAQVIIHGKVRADMNARDYHRYKTEAMGAVLESYKRLRSQYQMVLVEGAGSPAEINLRARDIANMGFAEAVDCPVVLVADIDRGGVFAHLSGTLDCLSESERARIVGFVINRFRGDISLLEPGLDWLEARTGKPVLAVLPYLHGLHLDAEDAIQSSQSGGAFRIIVPAVPRISNHTDFDALRAHPDVMLEFIGPGRPIPPADLVILPGSKNTRADLAWLRAQGWEQALQKHLRYGGKLIGICGGFQMLGNAVHDPDGAEGPAGSTPGLGLLALDTVMQSDKRLAQVYGSCVFPGAPMGAKVQGYEIHLGNSTGAALARPAFTIDGGTAEDAADAHRPNAVTNQAAMSPAGTSHAHINSTGRPEGAVSDDDAVLGTYLHGVFDHPDACQALLAWAGLRTDRSVDLGALREQSLDRVADASQGLYTAIQALQQPRPDVH